MIRKASFKRRNIVNQLQASVTCCAGKFDEKQKQTHTNEANWNEIYFRTWRQTRIQTHKALHFHIEFLFIYRFNSYIS